jgi:hypothetical protein
MTMSCVSQIMGSLHLYMRNLVMGVVVFIRLIVL